MLSTRAASPTWRPAETATIETEVPGSRSAASIPTATTPAIAATAAVNRVRARMPIPAPIARTTAATMSSNAGLSFVPNSDTTISLEPGGA